VNLELVGIATLGQTHIRLNSAPTWSFLDLWSWTKSSFSHLLSVGRIECTFGRHHALSFGNEDANEMQFERDLIRSPICILSACQMAQSCTQSSLASLLSQKSAQSIADLCSEAIRDLAMHESREMCCLCHKQLVKKNTVVSN